MCILSRLITGPYLSNVIHFPAGAIDHTIIFFIYIYIYIFCILFICFYTYIWYILHIRTHIVSIRILYHIPNNNIFYCVSKCYIYFLIRKIQFIKTRSSSIFSRQKTSTLEGRIINFYIILLNCLSLLPHRNSIP